jgi:hypothetical protein
MEPMMVHWETQLSIQIPELYLCQTLCTDIFQTSNLHLGNLASLMLEETRIFWILLTMSPTTILETTPPQLQLIHTMIHLLEWKDLLIHCQQGKIFSLVLGHLKGKSCMLRNQVYKYAYYM